MESFSSFISVFLTSFPMNFNASSLLDRTLQGLRQEFSSAFPWGRFWAIAIQYQVTRKQYWKKINCTPPFRLISTFKYFTGFHNFLVQWNFSRTFQGTRDKGGHQLWGPPLPPRPSWPGRLCLKNSKIRGG